MRIEKENNRIFYFPFTINELAVIISSARWALEGTKGKLSAEEECHLKQVLSNFEITENKFIEINGKR